MAVDDRLGVAMNPACYTALMRPRHWVGLGAEPPAFSFDVNAGDWRSYSLPEEDDGGTCMSKSWDNNGWESR